MENLIRGNPCLIQTSPLSDTAGGLEQLLTEATAVACSPPTLPCKPNASFFQVVRFKQANVLNIIHTAGLKSLLYSGAAPEK